MSEYTARARELIDDENVEQVAHFIEGAAVLIDENDKLRQINENVRAMFFACFTPRADQAMVTTWCCRHCFANGAMVKDDTDGSAALHDATCAKNPLVQQRDHLSREVTAKNEAILSLATSNMKFYKAMELALSWMAADDPRVVELRATLASEPR